MLNIDPNDRQFAVTMKVILTVMFVGLLVGFIVPMLVPQQTLKDLGGGDAGVVGIAMVIFVAVASFFASAILTMAWPMLERIFPVTFRRHYS